MGGEHLLKLTQSSIRSDYGRHFVDGSERREIWAELTALKMQLVEGFDAKKLKAAKSSPTLFAPKGLELRNRPSVIHRAQLRAERRTKSRGYQFGSDAVNGIQSGSTEGIRHCELTEKYPLDSLYHFGSLFHSESCFVQKRESFTSSKTKKYKLSFRLSLTLKPQQNRQRITGIVPALLTSFTMDIPIAF